MIRPARDSLSCLAFFVAGLAACGSSGASADTHDAGVGGSTASAPTDGGGGGSSHSSATGASGGTHESRTSTGTSGPRDGGSGPTLDASRDSATSLDAGRDGVAPSDAARDAQARDAARDAQALPDSGFTPGTPIAATENEWTWVPFPNAFCANGSTTGIGVNLSSASARVLLYLEGGGACWDDLTCYTLQTASYVTTGYGEADFVAESTDTTYLAEPGGFFDRTAASNPFKDYSYVYVPYCTGDVHAGANVVTLGTTPTQFVGFENVGAYLDRIVPTFPSADRVILAGSSAGGFGAALNWWRTQQAFGSIRVDVIDDSGTAMPDDVDEAGASTIAQQRAAWNLAATVPAGCTTCANDLSTLYGYYDSVFGAHRGALLSYTQDSVLPTFFGITEAEFTAGLDQDIATYFKPTDPLKSFVIGASGHVLFFSPSLATGAGVSVQQFVTQMVTDDTAWKDEGP